MFDTKDMVFLKIKLKHNSLSLRKYKKLSAQYCGPYVITKKINDQAYKLGLPPHIKVHNIFHVNLLRKYVPDLFHMFDDDQLTLTKDGMLEIQLESILQT